MATNDINQQLIIHVCIINYGKLPIVQTFWHKYSPLTDPKVPEAGLYNRTTWEACLETLLVTLSVLYYVTHSFNLMI